MQRLWAYITLGTTGILTEETSPIVGGLAAHNHELRFALVVLWVAGGVWAADLVLYYLGRWRGRWLRERWPAVRGVILRALRLVRRHPWRSSLAVRFAYGLRFTLPVACGAARLPLALYLVGSAISAFVWSLLFTTAGWGLGRTGRALGWHPKKYELTFIIVLVLVAIVVYLISRKRHVEDRTVEVLDPE